MDDEDISGKPRGLAIKIVGPCKSGKSTLVTGLKRLGYHARTATQEHSAIPDMWRRIDPADLLIFLDASLATIRARAPHDYWTQPRLDRQQQRLAHARQGADIVIMTDDLNPDEVLDRVVAFLRDWSVTNVPNRTSI